MQVQLKVANGNKAGQLISINRPRFLIGRAEDCHLKPKSELISRYHCAILSEDGYVAARDLGSKNGVFLNGHKIAIEEELKSGDHLVLGPLDFEIVLSVSLSAEKKPKIESIEQVVARTVERDTMVPAEPKGPSGDGEASAADWLMDEEDNSEVAGSTKTIQAAQLAELGLTEADQREASDLLNLKGDGKKGDTTKTVAVSAVLTPAASTPGTAPEGSTDPEAAANLLKNFFQGH